MPKGRILAVDDQRYFRELIEESCSPRRASRSRPRRAARRRCTCSSARYFDVVLTDLVMPGMNGSDLVQRVKARDPEQDIVVVTGVVDVQDRRRRDEARRDRLPAQALRPRRRWRSALEGDPAARRGCSSERDRLLAENIEFLGERALFERALGLFAASPSQPLAERIVEGLCLETQAQGGVLWVLASEGGLELAAARGLVRVDEEPEQLDPSQLPAALGDERTGSLLAPADPERAGAAPALLVPLRREGSLVGVARLTDKLEGDAFDDVDRVCAENFARLAEVALANALRFRRARAALARGSGHRRLHLEYFDDVVRNEIEKANRFGRSFALVELDLGPLDAAAPRGRRRRRADRAHRRRRRAGAAAARRRPARGGRRSAASACCSPRRTRSAPRVLKRRALRERSPRASSSRA